MIGNGGSCSSASETLESGRTQIKEFDIIAAANAGLTTIATITEQPCLIKSVVMHANSAQTVDLTSAKICGGDSQVIEFIPASSSVQSNLDAESKQISWQGAVRLPALATIVIIPSGTGATPLDLTVTIEYEACIDGGYLA